eukprot:CAMPEP_0183717328 /NCGR_PEP_ID=MMETSP0737-20130205/10975_1 /TAXON_ID=385413 /ORGANISM="Thalassiosira miniscula, Strain CCMP1093" /LENGTH=231 /DNA_ID=CAMNT_0025946745 /DNA_START=80 /DNA_END=775 /DNA_ORIENTATION=-
MNHSLAAVASRIQERNNALRSELTSLDLLKIQHDQAKQCLKADKLAAAEARKQLLTAVRARHGLELKCIQIDEESLKIEESISELQTKTEDIRSRTKELERKFDEEHAPIYAKHDLSAKLYSMRSEACLIAAQRKKQRREEKLRNLNEQTERQRGEASEMRTETERIREECSEMDRREEEDDEETVALNMQIKSMLAKKASLRLALNEAREMQQNASSNRDMWERRCVEGK